MKVKINDKEENVEILTYLYGGKTYHILLILPDETPLDTTVEDFVGRMVTTQYKIKE